MQSNSNKKVLATMAKQATDLQQAVMPLLANLKTRDAMYRFVQFSLRVLVAVRGICAANKHATSLLTARLQSLLSALSTGRKVFAFGNIAAELPNLLLLLSRLSTSKKLPT